MQRTGVSFLLHSLSGRACLRERAQTRGFDELPTVVAIKRRRGNVPHIAPSYKSAKKVFLATKFLPHSSSVNGISYEALYSYVHTEASFYLRSPWRLKWIST